MSTLTTYLANDASIAYSGFATNDTNQINYTAAQTAGATGVRRSTALNDTATFTCPIACRAIYLFSQAAVDFGNYSLSVNGNPWGTLSQYMGWQAAGGNFLGRSLTPLWRNKSGIDIPGPTIVIKNLSTSKVSVDYFLVVSGPKTSVVPNTMSSLGDSWTIGTGSQTPNVGGFASVLNQQLQTYFGRPIILTNNGLNGDETVAQDSIKIGGQHRFAQTVLPASPEFLTILFGANDLSSQNQPLPAHFYAENLREMLMLAEDTIDVYGEISGIPAKWAVGTPGWLVPSETCAPFSAATKPSMPSGLENLEMASALVKGLAYAHPWIRIADVFSAMDYRSELLYPNNTATQDSGLHPNETGHGVIARAFFTALAYGQS